MNENEEQSLRDKLKEISPTKELTARLVNLLVSNKPAGVSRSSSYPYYKEFYARQVQKDIDSMIATRQTIVYRYKTFCEGESCLSQQTLYLKVNQGIRYLCDHLDPEGDYKNWRKVINITRDKERGGVIVEYIPELRVSNAADFRGDMVVPDSHGTVPKWRIKMEDWLESDKEKPFIQEGLALNSEEIQELKVSLNMLSGIQCSITSSSVKIIKVESGDY